MQGERLSGKLLRLQLKLVLQQGQQPISPDDPDEPTVLRHRHLADVLFIHSLKHEIE